MEKHLFSITKRVIINNKNFLL